MSASATAPAVLARCIAIGQGLTRPDHASFAPKSRFRQAWTDRFRARTAAAVPSLAMEPLSAPDPAQAVATPADVCETVLASLDVGIVLEDPHGRALACNESARR